jgi:transcriptional regulator with XRE-family HTH domain
MLRGFQIRLGRLAVGWSQQQLAARAQVGVATIQRAERADEPPLTASNLRAIQRALEEAGIVFIDDGEQSLSGGPGLRRRG